MKSRHVLSVLLGLMAFAVAVAADQWVTVRLFDGRSTKGWVESGGRWRINSGWLSGFHREGQPPVLNFGQPLPRQFDLAMSTWNKGGYLSITLAESGPLPAPGGTSYEFALGWVQNTKLLVIGHGPDHQGLVYANLPFHWVPGTIHQLSWSIRENGISFAIDGTQMAQIPAPVSPKAGWRLTLQSHRARDTVIAFSSIHCTLPPNDAERIRP